MKEAEMTYSPLFIRGSLDRKINKLHLVKVRSHSAHSGARGKYVISGTYNQSLSVDVRKGPERSIFG